VGVVVSRRRPWCLPRSAMPCLTSLVCGYAPSIHAPKGFSGHQKIIRARVLGPLV
jgi:hypothetical protein